MCSAAIWSLRLCMEDVATAPLILAAMRLESTGNVRDSGVLSDAALASCRSSIVRAAVEVLVATKDNAKAAGDDVAWLTANEEAGRLIAHGLACAPNDGEMWAHSAQLAAERRDWSTVLEHVARSQRLAPADEATLRLRVTVWAGLPAAMDRGDDAARRSDLRVILAYGAPTLVRRLLATAPAWMLPQLREACAQLPMERRRFALELAPALGDSAEAVT